MALINFWSFYGTLWNLLSGQRVEWDLCCQRLLFLHTLGLLLRKVRANHCKTLELYELSGNQVDFFFYSQCGNIITMNTYIAFVPFGLKSVIRMWPEYLFLMAVISMKLTKYPPKSFSDWDHPQKTNGKPHYNFDSNCQLHKQNPYFPKRKLIRLPGKNLTLFKKPHFIFTKMYWVHLQLHHPPH